MTDPKDPGPEEPGAVPPEDAIRLFAGACDFFWGASSIENLPPPGQPEIAFAGRSNVGKSSLINALTGRKALARVSQTPGRTREINFFSLGGKLVLTDLPGYGYAKASQTLADSWQKLIFAYLRGRAPLRRAVLLIDSRRGIMEVDRAVMKLLDAAAVSYILTLTKIDQLTQPDRSEAIRAAGEEAHRHTAAYPQVLATSAEKKLGLEDLKIHLAALAALRL
jgi:GTP-binding protein